MDGYAVRSDESSRTLFVVDELRAGDWKPRELAPGQAVRVATGTALPNAELRVIPSTGVVQATLPRWPRIEALLRLPPGVGNLPTGARVALLPLEWPGLDRDTRVS